MKTAGKVLLWFLIGTISTVVFFTVLILGTFSLIYFHDDLKYPKFKAERIYAQNEEEFNTVAQYINDFDFSPFEAGLKHSSAISIYPPDTLSEDEEYRMDISNQYEEAFVTITDKKVNLALNWLFEKIKMESIIQSSNKDTRTILFSFAYSVGIAYSPDGEQPEFGVDDRDYWFKRINDSWFYWTGHWPD